MWESYSHGLKLCNLGPRFCKPIREFVTWGLIYKAKKVRNKNWTKKKIGFKTFGKTMILFTFSCVNLLSFMEDICKNQRWRNQ